LIVLQNHEKVGKVKNIKGFHQKTNEKVGNVVKNNDFGRKTKE